MIVYEDEFVTLYHGDCLEELAWLGGDVLITDPPYGMNYWSNWGGNHDLIKGDNATTTRDQALQKWGDKPAAVFGTWRQPPPTNTVNQLVWDKTDGVGTGMGNLDAAFGHTHEEIYILGTWLRGDKRRLPSVLRTKVNMRDLASKVNHPTPKPVELLSTLIDAAPDGVIVDPFAGSGSTLIAARNLGRKTIGIELDPNYAKLAAARLSNQPLFPGEL